MKTPLLARVQFVVKLIGAVAVLAYCAASGAQQLRQHWFVAILIVAFEAASVFQPFSVTHAGTRDEFTPDLMVAAAAALLLPTSAGALAIPCGYLLGFVLRGELSLAARLDDMAGIAIAIFLALTLAHLIGAPGLGLNSIVGSLIVVVAYDVLGLILLSIEVAANKRGEFWTFFRNAMTVSVAIWPWLMCLGVLIGTIGWDAPWALPLMAAPLALVLMASRSRVDATEDRTRLDGLLKATTEILAATTTVAVTTAAASSIALLFEGQDGRVDMVGPGEGELGAPIGDRYLIAPARTALVLAYTEHDRLLLETLASVTASAMEKAALHEDVTEQATRDALTGLANRRAFEAELASSVIGKRSTDASGVMFLDLDGFKKINDEYGHKAGDEVLVETAKRLLDSVRDSDTVARLGGDEFTVLLRGVHNKDEAIIVAERILAAMREPMRLSTGVDVHPTPSLGIALASGTGTDPSTLLKDADAAMYEAKRAGKDCWRLAYDGLSVVVGE